MFDEFLRDEGSVVVVLYIMLRKKCMCSRHTIHLRMMLLWYTSMREP